MLAKEQIHMREAAVKLQQALYAAGHEESIELIENMTAIRVGSFDEYFTIRYVDNLWQLRECSPRLHRVMTYETLEECARDIAMHETQQI